MSNFQEVIDAKPGHVFYDAYEDGIRVLVLRGPTSLCAYLGIPDSHPLADFDYDALPLRVHGGLTYSGKGVKGAPDGMFWFGWDYSHAGDKSVYRDGVPEHHRNAKGWTPKEVIAEAKDAVWDFKKLVVLAERIHLKKIGWIMGEGRVH